MNHGEVMVVWIVAIVMFAGIIKAKYGYGRYGRRGHRDQGIPVDTVEKMRAALKAAGKTSEIVVYPDAPHGFHADYRPSYRKEAAEDAWNRMVGWFKKYKVLS